MRLAMVAVVAFFLGSMAPLFTPIRTVFAQQFDDNGFPRQNVPEVPPLRAAVPKVFPLANIHVQNNLVIGGPGSRRGLVFLDGVETEGNAWVNPSGTTFVYGGGAYKLEKNSIGGPIDLVLTGAAANTAHLLYQFGILEPSPNDTFTAPVKKNVPIIHKKVFRKPLNGDMESQYDGTEQPQ